MKDLGEFKDCGCSCDNSPGETAMWVCNICGKPVEFYKHTSQLKAKMPSDEVKEAIEFITDNPDQNIYISENIKHFVNDDEPDDNSIQLYDDWIAEYTKVVDWLKDNNQHILKEEGDEKTKNKVE